MKELDLPDPIAAYFDADRRDGQAVARCFTTDGVVIDEGGTHSGLAAIETWKSSGSARYAYTARPHTLERHAQRYIVTSQVSGNFPGSPLDLRYTFALERGKIASLEIAP
ncbi:nuclear transport factor 2 family protein [Xanthomonas campestris]|uniref:nuclear transport factor 2 family protein n=1 Tax=Xanthomonas campestris TaxID=339 RepID=UPI000CDB558C|nr:nuclear transport factor 2 family protein [Xanthomonas campestris]TXD44896.1 nuclear transport factor 2 family protein [Xanthomonas campestris]